MTPMATYPQIERLIRYGIDPEEARGYTRPFAETKLVQFEQPLRHESVRRAEAFGQLPAVPPTQTTGTVVDRPRNMSSLKQVRYLAFLGYPEKKALRLSKKVATQMIEKLLVKRNREPVKPQFQRIK